MLVLLHNSYRDIYLSYILLIRRRLQRDHALDSQMGDDRGDRFLQLHIPGVCYGTQHLCNYAQKAQQEYQRAIGAHAETSEDERRD